LPVIYKPCGHEQQNDFLATVLTAYSSPRVKPQCPG
jgi:hypothetical protein